MCGFDCLITNVDRTARNTNMLMWKRDLWLIDHGASLYFHHAWQNFEEQAIKPFLQVKDHVLLPQASAIEKSDEKFRALLNEEIFAAIVSLIPGEWLREDGSAESADEKKNGLSKIFNHKA